MKKLLILVVIGIFVLSGLEASAFFQNHQSSQNKGEELDQYQEVMTENALIPIGNIPIPDNPLCIQVAQSFVPTKTVLTRLELYIGKNSTATRPLVVSIRKELTNDDLTVMNIDPSSVPTETFEWIEINFDDIVVTPGLAYYVVALTENITENFYAWGANNISESYALGCAWISLDEGDTWTNESTSNQYNSDLQINQNSNPRFDETYTWDTCFRTYGLDNQPPDDPIITGPNNGKPNIDITFTVMTNDPEEDNIFYCIDWGDGSPEETIGPCPSGSDTTATHKWSEIGDYVIRVKAKDIYNAESSWVNFDISIPRNKGYILNLLLRINQFSIIQAILYLLNKN